MADNPQPAEEPQATDEPEPTAAERLRKLHAECRRDYEQAKAYRDLLGNFRRYC